MADAGALVDALDAPANRLVVDSSVGGMGTFVALGAPGARHLWLTWHNPPAGDAPQLRFASLGEDGTMGIATIPYPFPAPFAGLLVNGGDLLVAGPRDSPSGQTVQTLVLRFRMRCPGP